MQGFFLFFSFIKVTVTALSKLNKICYKIFNWKKNVWSFYDRTRIDDW